MPVKPLAFIVLVWSMVWTGSSWAQSLPLAEWPFPADAIAASFPQPSWVPLPAVLGIAMLPRTRGRKPSTDSQGKPVIESDELLFMANCSSEQCGLGAVIITRTKRETNTKSRASLENHDGFTLEEGEFLGWKVIVESKSTRRFQILSGLTPSDPGRDSEHFFLTSTATTSELALDNYRALRKLLVTLKNDTTQRRKQ